MIKKHWVRPEIIDGIPTIYGWIVRHPGNLLLSEGTDIGAFTYIQAECGVEIGCNVQIGAHCAIYSRSTIDDKSGRVVLCRGAKIGTHSTIMPGVTIGEDAIIGAHSFVNRDIPAGCLAYGVPVKLRTLYDSTSFWFRSWLEPGSRRNADPH